MTDMNNVLRRTLAAVLLLIPASRASDLELRGFFGTAESPEVSLREGPSGRSRWISRGEFDGEIYVESVNMEKGCAVVYAGLSRLELRLAPASAAEDGSRPAGTSSDEVVADREPTEAADIFRIRVNEGFRRLRRDHPEYFEGDTNDSDLRALRAERRRIMEEAEAAVRAAE